MRSPLTTLISWSLVAGLIAGCGFDPQPGVYAACDADGDCPAGCRCVAGWICATDAANRAPWECRAEGPACEADTDCKLGCACADGVCAPAAGLADRIDGGYCAAGLAPTCMPADRVVTSPAELAEALGWAADTPGAHRIQLDPVDGLDWPVSEALPPVPGLTYLEGNGVRLVGDGSRPGLQVDGVGVAISDLELAAFGGVGLLVAAGSRDVNLFRLRVLDTASITDPIEPDGHGIHLAGEAARPVERVSIGRGRTSACVAPVTIEHPDPSYALNAQFDVNVIRGNAGDGIRVDHGEQIFIYGTWVGFDNLNDPSHNNGAEFGNGGAGVHLVETTNARIGSQQLLDSEARTGEHSPLPAAVGIGRNRAAGLIIEGGGRIEAPGLFLGSASTMVPFDQNEGPALIIDGNRDFVFIGPAPQATGAAAQHFGEVYSDGRPMVQIKDNQAPVWVRAMQIWSTGEAGLPRAGVEVIRAHAPVHLVHLTFVFFFELAGVYIENLQPGGRVELLNSLFLKGSTDPGTGVVCVTPGVPVLVSSQSDGDPDPGALDLRGNMEHCFPGWCQGDCESLDESDNRHLEPGTFACTSDNVVPLVPTCPNVDAGLELERQPGQPMHLVGLPDAPFAGCGPDVGMFECTTSDCRSVACP